MHSQISLPRRRRGILKALSTLIFLVLLVIGGVGIYVLAAPPDLSQTPPKLQLYGRSALRKRPSVNSAPIAYTKETGTLVFQLGLRFLSSLNDGTLSEQLLFQIGVGSWANLEKKKLFQIEQKFQNELDNRRVSADLRQTFADHRILLSQNSSVAIETQGSKWRITDKQSKLIYEVWKESTGLNIYTPFDNFVVLAKWDQAFASKTVPNLSQYATINSHPEEDTWQIINGDGAAYIIRKVGNQLKVYTEDLQRAFDNKGVWISQEAELSTVEKGQKWTIVDVKSQQAYDIREESSKLNVYKRSKMEIVPLLFAVDLASQSDLDNGVIPEVLAQAFEKNRIPLSPKVTVSIEKPDDTTEKPDDTIEKPHNTWLVVDNGQKYIIKKDGRQYKVYLNLESQWLRVRIEGEIKGWVQSDQGVVIHPPAPKLSRRQYAKQRLLELADKLRGK